MRGTSGDWPATHTIGEGGLNRKGEVKPGEEMR